MARNTCPLPGVGEPLKAPDVPDSRHHDAIADYVKFIEEAYGIKTADFPGVSSDVAVSWARARINPGKAGPMQRILAERLGLQWKLDSVRLSDAGRLSQGLNTANASMRAALNTAGQRKLTIISDRLRQIRQRNKLWGRRQQRELDLIFRDMVEGHVLAKADPSTIKSAAQRMEDVGTQIKIRAEALGISNEDVSELWGLATAAPEVFNEIFQAARKRGLTGVGTADDIPFFPHMRTRTGDNIISGNSGSQGVGAAAVMQGRSGRTQERTLKDLLVNVDTYRQTLDDNTVRNLVVVEQKGDIVDGVQHSWVSRPVIEDDGRVTYQLLSVPAGELEEAAVDFSTASYKYFQQRLLTQETALEFMKSRGYNPNKIEDVVRLFSTREDSIGVFGRLSESTIKDLTTSGLFKGLDMSASDAQNFWMSTLRTPTNVELITSNFVDAVNDYRKSLAHAAAVPAELQWVANVGGKQGWSFRNADFIAATRSGTINRADFVQMHEMFKGNEIVWDNLEPGLRTSWVHKNVAEFVKARHLTGTSMASQTAFANWMELGNTLATTGQLLSSPMKYLNAVAVDAGIKATIGGASPMQAIGNMPKIGWMMEGNFAKFDDTIPFKVVNGVPMTEKRVMELYWGRRGGLLTNVLGDRAIDSITSGDSIIDAVGVLRGALSKDGTLDISAIPQFVFQRIMSVPGPHRTTLGRAWEVGRQTGQPVHVSRELAQGWVEFWNTAFQPLAKSTEVIESGAHLAIFLNSLPAASNFDKAFQSARQLGPFAPRVVRQGNFEEAYIRASEFILDPTQVGSAAKEVSRKYIPFFSHSSQAIPASFRWTMRHPTRALQLAGAITDWQANQLGEPRNSISNEPWSPLALAYDIRPDGRMVSWEFGRSAEIVESWPLIIQGGKWGEQLWKAYRGSRTDIDSYFGGVEDIVTNVDLKEGAHERVLGTLGNIGKQSFATVIEQSMFNNFYELFSETDLRGRPIVYEGESEFFVRFSSLLRPFRTLERTGAWRKLFGHHNMYDPSDPEATDGILRHERGLLGGPELGFSVDDWTSQAALDTLYEDMFGFKISVRHPEEAVIRAEKQVDTWYSEQGNILGERRNELLRLSAAGEDITKRWNRLIDDYQWREEVYIWKWNVLADYRRNYDVLDEFMTREAQVNRVKLLLGVEAIQ